MTSRQRANEERDWRDERDDEVDDKDVPVDEYPNRDEYDRLAREFRG